MTINFKKLTVGVHPSFADDCPDWMKKAFTQEHIFKSADDAGDFARHILDELANRRVNLKMTVSGHDVEYNAISYDCAKRIKSRHPEAVITEAGEPEPGIEYGFFGDSGEQIRSETFNTRLEAISWWRKHYKWKFSIVDGTPSFSNPNLDSVKIREIPPPVEKPARPSHEMIGNLKPGDVVDIETGGEKWRVEITGRAGTRDNYWSRPFYSFFCDGGVIEFTQNDIVGIVSMPIQKPVTFEEFFNHFVKKHEDIIDIRSKYFLAEVWRLEMAYRESKGFKTFCNPYLDIPLPDPSFGPEDIAEII